MGRLVTLALVVILGLVACGPAQPEATRRDAVTNSPTPHVGSVDPVLDRVARQVSSIVTNVLTLVGEAKQNPPLIDVGQVLQGAQYAHGSLDIIKKDGANAFTHSGGGGRQMLKAVDGLENSMSALVVYLGNPSPATRAGYTTQWTTGQTEWNNAVRSVYAGARGTKPLIG